MQNDRNFIFVILLYTYMLTHEQFQRTRIPRMCIHAQFSNNIRYGVLWDTEYTAVCRHTKYHDKYWTFKFFKDSNARA